MTTNEGQEENAGEASDLGDDLERYRPLLRVIALRHLGTRLRTRVDASDVVQQTFLEAFKDAEKFRGNTEKEWIAWLRQILENNIQEVVRHHIATQKRSIAKEQSVANNGSSPGIFQLLPGETSTPSKRAMRTEDAVRLAGWLDTLNSDQSNALRLRYIEGFTLRELAQHFERTEVAVAGLLKRGLQNLRTIAGSEDEKEEEESES